MPFKKIIQALKNYRKASESVQRIYLDNFEKKMMYRTTKTENQETTQKMVKKVLRKFQ